MPKEKGEKRHALTKYRSAAPDIESTFRAYETNLKKLSEAYETGCEAEISALREAEENLEKKITDLKNSAEIKEMEEKAHKSSTTATLQLADLQHEFRKQEARVMGDRSLTPEERRATMSQLYATMANDYKELASKYPSAIKAAMMRAAAGPLLLG